MDPASRNRVLMIGGALIVIALLLVCGPLQGRFGSRDIEEAPSVAAGPPAVDASPGVEPDVRGTQVGEIAAAGALAGAAIGESGLAGALAEDEAGASAAAVEPAVVVTAPVVPPVVAKAAPKTSKATPRPRAAKLPAVSAAPIAVASVPLALTTEQRAAEAQDAFDSARPNAMLGKLVDRFAPPVASGPGVSALALAASQGFSTRGGGVIRTCDSPGSGCRNSAPRLQAGNSPIGSTNPRARGPRQAVP